jgi:ATPase subunit of ABC transporter with duplicated ATPase domains
MKREQPTILYPFCLLIKLRRNRGSCIGYTESMSLLRLNNVTMKYGDKSVLRNVYFKLNEGERVGLIGKNGTGKTTILKLILEQIEPTTGTVERELNLKVGYFSQFSSLDGSRTVQQTLENLFADLRALDEELTQIAAALEIVEDPDEMERLLERQAAGLEEMTHRDGWEYPRHIDTVLTKLGFNQEHRERPIDQLSGGWRNRAALARILLEAPDLLLLDEPTNYLDVEGLAWLEGWLNTFRGGLILVSHDRQFLDAVVTRIVEVENYQFQEYLGSFTQYIREKQFKFKTLEKQFLHEEELLTFEAEAISDREEAKRNPSQGLQRKLADLKKRREPRPVDALVTIIYEKIRVPDLLCAATHLSKSYGDQPLFKDVSFEVEKGERLAIVGPNGSGKSTLLRLLTQEEKSDSGEVVWPGGVFFSDFNQILAELDVNDTVTHAVNVSGLGFSAPRKQVNKFLTLLQFSEMDLNQRIGTLSGGQRARVALAKCLLSEAQVLILDEPTNHLDLTSTQVMERALVNFPGSIILVSHDRFFLDKVATRMLIFEANGETKDFNGNWTMWQASQGQAASEAK